MNKFLLFIILLLVLRSIAAETQIESEFNYFDSNRFYNSSIKNRVLYDHKNLFFNSSIASNDRSIEDLIKNLVFNAKYSFKNLDLFYNSNYFYINEDRNFFNEIGGFKEIKYKKFTFKNYLSLNSDSFNNDIFVNLKIENKYKYDRITNLYANLETWFYDDYNNSTYQLALERDNKFKNQIWKIKYDILFSHKYILEKQDFNGFKKDYYKMVHSALYKMTESLYTNVSSYRSYRIVDGKIYRSGNSRDFRARYLLKLKKFGYDEIYLKTYIDGDITDDSEKYIKASLGLKYNFENFKSDIYFSRYDSIVYTGNIVNFDLTYFKDINKSYKISLISSNYSNIEYIPNLFSRIEISGKFCF